MEQVGEFSERVIDVLGLSIKAGTPIYIGKSNIDHMREAHYEDYRTYGRFLKRILKNPDYVRLDDIDDSIEFVKVISEYVKVAVRVAGDGLMYVRTLYTTPQRRVENLVAKGEMKRLTKTG